MSTISRCPQCGEELTTGHGHMLPKAQLVDVSYAREILMFQDRIRKAREILEGFRVTTFGKVAAPVINDALEALEGK